MPKRCTDILDQNFVRVICKKSLEGSIIGVDGLGSQVVKLTKNGENRGAFRPFNAWLTTLHFILFF